MSLYSTKQNGGSTSNDNDGDDYEPDKKLKTTPDAGFTGTLRTVFGNENQWGQTLGVAFKDVTIEDGVLYKHAEKDNSYKLFAWEEVIGAHPAQYEEEVSADKPDQFMTKTYGSNRVQYEFVGARIAPVPEMEEGDDGEMVETGDLLCEEDTAGDIDVGNVIMWNDGNVTPSASSKTLAQLLTEQGTDMVVDKEVAENRATEELYNDDGEFMWVYDWLTDVSNDNIARSDLVDRELRFYKVARQSDSSDNFFHHPIVEDVKTGKQIQVRSSGSGSGDSDSAEREAESAEGTPEPVQDYLDTVGGMSADETLARSLLDDMVEEPDNNLTEDMVEQAGGRSALIEQVTGTPA